MTPSPLRTRRALAAVAALPLLLLSVSACGDDASEAADALDSASEALDSASGAVESTDEELLTFVRANEYKIGVPSETA